MSVAGWPLLLITWKIDRNELLLSLTHFSASLTALGQTLNVAAFSTKWSKTSSTRKNTSFSVTQIHTSSFSKTFFLWLFLLFQNLVPNQTNPMALCTRFIWSSCPPPSHHRHHNISSSSSSYSYKLFCDLIHLLNFRILELIITLFCVCLC